MKNIIHPIDIVGELLSEVAFVQDYIQLRFDGASLTFYSHPLIKTDWFDGKYPDSGSRDALCSLIGKEVSSVQLDDEKELVLVFKPNDVVTLPLDWESRTPWGEAMLFSGREGGRRRYTPVQVW